MLLEEFVDGEGDGLAGGDSHDTGGNALVESVETFLPVKIVSQSFNWGFGGGWLCNILEHVLGNASYSVPSAVTGLSRSPL